MTISPYIAYFDESGDHGINSIDPASPIFVLCGLVYRRAEYLEHDLATLTSLKMELWGHDALVFHSHKIRNRLKPFERLLHDDDFSRDLMTGISGFFAGSRATIIAAAVDKPAHRDRYVTPHDPYELTLTFCLERLYLNFPRHETRGMVCVFESRGKKEDAILEGWFDRICGGQNALNTRLPFRCCFASKHQNLVGLQAADLAAYPIAKHVQDRSGQRPDWMAVLPKIYRNGQNEIYGYGLKIFP